METSKSEEQQFDQKLEKANKAKEEYSQLYKELVDNLRVVVCANCSHISIHIAQSPACKYGIKQLVELLEDIVNILKADNVAFKKDILLDNFKTNLLHDVVSSMEKSWVTCNIGVNIATLEILKDKFKHRVDAKWRPTGKMVEEQTLPIRVQKLDVQCNYLRKQVNFQNAKLEELLQQNAIYRNDMEQVKLQRSFIQDQMHRGTAELQNLKCEYEEAIVQVLKQD